MNRYITSILGIIITALGYQSNYAALPQPTQPTLKPLTLTRSVSNTAGLIRKVARSAAAIAQDDTDQSTMDVKSRNEGCVTSQTAAAGTCASTSAQSATQNPQRILTLRQAMDYASSLMPPMPDEATDVRAMEEIEKTLVVHEKMLEKDGFPGLIEQEVRGITNLVISGLNARPSTAAAANATALVPAQPVVAPDPILTLDEALAYAASLIDLPFKWAKADTLEAIEEDLAGYLEITQASGINKTVVKSTADHFIEQARAQIFKRLTKIAKK